MSFDCSAGHLFLAISSSADPMGSWTSYRFDYAGEIPDYPGLGSSSDKVVLGVNEFGIVPSGGTCDGGAFVGASLLVIDWSDLMAAGTVSFSATSADPSLFAWRPATSLSTTTTLPAVLEVLNGAATDVGYATVSGTNGGGNVAVSTVEDLTTAGVVAGFSAPPIPIGATAFNAGTDDERPTDALWQGGKLWFVSTYPCTPVGDVALRDCVRATELDTSTATPTQSQDFLLGSIGYDFFYGGIGLAQNGTLYLVFSASSAATHISTYAAARLPGDPLDTYGNLTLVVPGAATYSGSRWGDYVGVAQDPSLPDSVWQADEYPDASGRWATKVTRLFVDTTPPTGSFVLAGGAISTQSPRVGVTDAATDTETGVAAMRVSNDGATWDTLSYATSFTWDITDPAYGGTASPGTKTVSMEWQDGAGNWSNPTMRSIVLLPGSTYHAIDPARILDSRFGTGLSGAFHSQVARTFQVSGQGGVDPAATAVTGNLTVTGQTAAGYLFLGPIAADHPTSSTLNFPLGDTRANGVTVELGAGGSLSATYVATNLSSTAQIIFDVTGYFTPDATGSTYHAIDPARILDSRFGTGLSGAFHSQVARTFQVSGQGGVDPAATAVTGNLTVTGQTAAGYLFLGPIAADHPTSSTLNFPLGDTRANGVTVELGAGGSLSATYVATNLSSTAQIIFDVTGYFTP